MKRFDKILILFLLVAASTSSYAQFDTEITDSLENKILYNRQKTYGIVLHNLGMGLVYRTGKRLSIFKTRMYEIEFVSMKSYKQVKMIKPIRYKIQKRYVYGKTNDVLFFFKELM